MHQFQAKDKKGEDNFEDWREDEKIILKWLLKKVVVRSRTVFTGLSSESTGGFQWTQAWTYRFHKTEIASSAVERLLASPDRFYSTNVVYSSPLCCVTPMLWSRNLQIISYLCLISSDTHWPTDLDWLIHATSSVVSPDLLLYLPLPFTKKSSCMNEKPCHTKMSPYDALNNPTVCGVERERIKDSLCPQH